MTGAEGVLGNGPADRTVVSEQDLFMTQTVIDKQARIRQILIVEVHPDVRTRLARAINHESDLHVCAKAKGCNQALKAMDDHKPDVAVVDLTSLDTGGLEMVKWSATSHPDLPMIVLSTRNDTFYAERVLRAGAKGYIAEQQENNELITAIRVILRGQVYVSAKVASKLLGQLVTRGRRTKVSGCLLETLSDRELEVFELIGHGHATRRIAERLGISIKTVESHREHIKEKLKLRNAKGLVHTATRWVVRDGVYTDLTPSR